MQKKFVNPSPSMQGAQPIGRKKNSSTHRLSVCHETRATSLFEKADADAIPFRAAQISLSEYSIAFFFLMYFVYVS